MLLSLVFLHHYLRFRASYVRNRVERRRALSLSASDGRTIETVSPPTLPAALASAIFLAGQSAFFRLGTSVFVLSLSEDNLHDVLQVWCPLGTCLTLPPLVYLAALLLISWLERRGALRSVRRSDVQFYMHLVGVGIGAVCANFPLFVLVPLTVDHGWGIDGGSCYIPSDSNPPTVVQQWWRGWLYGIILLYAVCFGLNLVLFLRHASSRTVRSLAAREGPSMLFFILLAICTLWVATTTSKLATFLQNVLFSGTAGYLVLQVFVTNAVLRGSCSLALQTGKVVTFQEANLGLQEYNAREYQDQEHQRLGEEAAQQRAVLLPQVQQLMALEHPSEGPSLALQALNGIMKLEYDQRIQCEMDPQGLREQLALFMHQRLRAREQFEAQRKQQEHGAGGVLGVDLPTPESPVMTPEAGGAPEDDKMVMGDSIDNFVVES